jgi:hypothetical protein
MNRHRPEEAQAAEMPDTAAITDDDTTLPLTCTLPTGARPLELVTVMPPVPPVEPEPDAAPSAPRPRRDPLRSRSLTCGRGERAALYRALMHAIVADGRDEVGRDVVGKMDDSVLAFLVRAIVNGQLAPDGRLFIRPEEIACLTNHD